MKDYQKISSRENQHVKFARRVREGKEHDEMFIEGTRLVEEAVAAGVRIKSIFVSEKALENERIVSLLSAIDDSFAVFVLATKIFDSIAETPSPQGIIAVSERPETGRESIESALKNENGVLKIVVGLYSIGNPSNLGAIIRTAEAAGVAGVVTTKGSADPFTPAALRGSMGSSFRVPIWPGVPIDELVRWSRSSELHIAATDIRGSSSYLKIDWRIPRLLIFGSEAHGIPGGLSETVDERIGIPMQNGVESLNLAVSAGIMLFEARRQATDGADRT